MDLPEPQRGHPIDGTMIEQALPANFFSDEPLVVARRLVGQRLVRRLEDELLVGRIVEVEAYGGPGDSTSHAARGAGGRAAGMWGAPGRAYVYLIYGMHACLNAVAHGPGGVGAVLIRALEPEQGVAHMRARRNEAPLHLLTSGPGRLCAALAIDRSFDGVDLCRAAAPLFLAPGIEVGEDRIHAGPRVGVVGRPEHTGLSWRFYVADSPFVSPGRRTRSAARG